MAASGVELLAPSLAPQGLWPGLPPAPPPPLPPSPPSFTPPPALPPPPPPPRVMGKPSGVDTGGAARRGGRLRVVCSLPLPRTAAPGLSAGEAGDENFRGDRLRGVSGMASPPHPVSAAHGVVSPPSEAHAALCSCATRPSSACTRARREAHSACAARRDLLLTAARTASSNDAASAIWCRSSSRDRRAALSWREVAADCEGSARLSRRRASFASICACSRTSRSCRCWRSMARRYSGSPLRLALRGSSVLPCILGVEVSAPLCRYTALHRASAASCMFSSCPRAASATHACRERAIASRRALLAVRILSRQRRATPGVDRRVAAARRVAATPPTSRTSTVRQVSRSRSDGVRLFDSCYTGR